jgi:hypothetical protein
MRTLSSTLLAAQKETGRTPFIKVEAKNRIAGVVRLDWTRLYTGSEDEGPHALTIPGDGSLIRVRISPAGDGCKLYRQRVTSPGPGSDFSVWTYTGQYNCLAVAAASLGAEVSVFWINDSQEIRRIKSADNGASWGSPELVDYSPTAQTGGITAAYKPDGDLAVFFANETSLYIKKRTAGAWQEKTSWDNPPQAGGELSGVAAVYDGDWDLVVSGRDSSGCYKLWSLVYGDGGDVPADTWSQLKELASAPSGGYYEYRGVFLDKPDVFRCYYTEKFSGGDSYSRLFWTHSVLESGFPDSLWREPVPFNLSCEHGMAVAHSPSAGCCWLSTASGVWRSGLAEISLDLTPGVLSLKIESSPVLCRLALELNNDEGNYAQLPPPLEIGCQLEISPGYVTSQGNEISPGMTFMLESCEYRSSGGKSSLLLQAYDGLGSLNTWRARNQFRWNSASPEVSVKRMIEFVFARAGLKLEIVSQSPVITDYCPDFTIHNDSSGNSSAGKLLSFIPDVIFVEGHRAFLLNPQTTDSPVYSFGEGHDISEGNYHTAAWGSNRVLVEGYDPVNQSPVLEESFNWDQISRLYDRFKQVEDENLVDGPEVQQRGLDLLRKAETASINGSILVPPNCGQQLYDVIEITDSRAGLSREKRRVLGMILSYIPSQGKYEQRLTLAAV